MIVVTGATGNVGRMLVRPLAEAGGQVWPCRGLPHQTPAEGVRAVRPTSATRRA